MKALTINVSSKHPHGVNRGYSITRRDFDVDVLNRLGFGRDEVFELVNARQYNAGVSYDPHSGVFEGTVDSTD